MKLELKNVSKTYHSNIGPIKALENINLGVKEKEFISIIGPSGCGKTTLLNIIAGLEKADAGGEVLIDYLPVEGPGQDRVVIFQQDALFPWLNVIGNVQFGMKFQNLPSKEIRQRAEKYLFMVNLKKFQHSYIHELSGGMKQRVALARALVVNPSILLMDEPFCALDAQTRETLQTLLQYLWMITAKTIIFVTHNVREAVCLGDRVLVMTMRPGRIKKEFKVDLARPRSLNSTELIEVSNLVMGELRGEIEKVAEEELVFD